MKKFKLVVRIVFVLYISLSVLIGYNDEILIKEGFSIFWDRGIFNFYENMKYWGLFGIILIVLEFSMENLLIYRLKKENNVKEAEIIKLKAQMFDLQGAIKQEPAQAIEPAVEEEINPSEDKKVE
ncbi:MAG: hypothetical protein O2887_03520 [Bacteroidetes bacterium]|nr:hypothetical protein [Bacteroidota bacterium]MDA1119555.1 hypothetical protein [Bacteroidota bacterium]